MDFPINDLLDPQRCHDFLLNMLHPSGLKSPCGHPFERSGVHQRKRAPILDYRCKVCGRVFNLFTDTKLHGTHYTTVQIVQMLRGFSQGTPTAQLAREMGVDRMLLLKRRHKMQEFVVNACPRKELEDSVTETDEMYQNAGEKRGAPSRSRRSSSPPRQQSAWARNLGQRSASDLRNRRAPKRSDTPRCDQKQHAG